MTNSELSQETHTSSVDALDSYEHIKFEFLKLLKQFKIFDFDKFMKWLERLVYDYQRIGYNIIEHLEAEFRAAQLHSQSKKPQPQPLQMRFKDTTSLPQAHQFYPIVPRPAFDLMAKAASATTLFASQSMPMAKSQPIAPKPCSEAAPKVTTLKDEPLEVTDLTRTSPRVATKSTDECSTSSNSSIIVTNTSAGIIIQQAPMVEASPAGDSRLPHLFKPKITEQQINALESVYRQKPYLNQQEKMQLSKLLSITPMQVKSWFKNRRYRQKKYDSGLSTTNPSKAMAIAPGSKLNAIISQLGAHDTNGSTGDDVDDVDDEMEDDEEEAMMMMLNDEGGSEKENEGADAEHNQGSKDEVVGSRGFVMNMIEGDDEDDEDDDDEDGDDDDEMMMMGNGDENDENDHISLSDYQAVMGLGGERAKRLLLPRPASMHNNFTAAAKDGMMNKMVSIGNAGAFAAASQGFLSGTGASFGSVRFSKLLNEELEKVFDKQKYLSNSQRDFLAEKFQVPTSQITNWFQNKRRKLKRLERSAILSRVNKSNESSENLGAVSPTKA